MKNRMKRNLLIGFGISLIILVISSIASYTSIRSLLDSAKMVDHSNKIVLNLEQVISTMKDAETGQRGFLITGLNEFLEPYTGSYEQVVSIIAEVKTLTADNLEQQKSINQLNEIIKKRFSKLQLLIDRKKAGTPIEIADMREGNFFMDSVRLLINEMQIRENVLLAERTNELRNFTQFTPVLIMLAALAAVIITIMFYIKMSKDIDVRTRLQDELLGKDAAIAHRLEIIRNVSSCIAGGDYSVRVPEENESDNIGSIAGSLNNMAAALDQSFAMLSNREWIQAGEAGLSQAIIGSEIMNTLAERMISFITGYTDSQVAALYINQHNGALKLQYAYGVSASRVKQYLQLGEGLAGECLLAKKRILLEGITEDDFNMTVLAGEIKPVNLIAFPLIYEGTTMAVIELGSFHPFTERTLKFFERIEEHSGIAIDSIQNRQKIQELLEETQSQAEELMSQQSELEQINAELEEQAQQLQSSEEELKVQS
jgi:CHASE3 domain sensor protein